MAEFETVTVSRYCSLINRLPDEVLHLILDKLPIEDAVRTGVLSHRWRNLWKYITNIKFVFEPSWETSTTGKEIVQPLNQFIRNYLGEKIKAFTVELAFHHSISDEVDSWIQFATSKKVEKLNLDFDVSNHHIPDSARGDHPYKLNPCIFKCESLEMLTLRWCVIELPQLTSLHNLKQVYLRQMELPEDAIYRLTSNSPVLEVLNLEDCNGTSDFHIIIAPNPHFQKLLIYEEFPVDTSTTMVVLAPNTKEFILTGYMPRKKYRIENMLQCVNVGFYFNHMYGLCTKEEEGDEEEGLNVLVDDENTQRTEDKLLEILCSFQETRCLQICDWCIQMVSSRERRNTGRISLNCLSLELYTNFLKWELPGIVYMLKACHKLEHLLIVIPPYPEEIELPEDYLMHYDFQANGYLINAIQDFVDPLQKLKTVEIKNNRGDHQTWDPESFEMHRFFQGAELGIELMILLRRIAVNLQHVIFSTNKQKHVLSLMKAVVQ
ncbi:hypothetical protein F0562_014294 [Nyssa sinensis]|uniref:F-box domain-containing protein n=1 Tax=Nyssa sinensis TaxID=561372 RepID=A0A5J4ZRH4_9ASTE|nr:hypothetical protein F0562_014294 [Nyssa sinensis]